MQQVESASFEVKEKIEELEKLRKSDLNRGYKLLSNYLKDLHKEFNKLKDGAGRLQDHEDDIMEDGGEKARKKGRMFVNSLKALGEYARYVSQESSELEIPKSKEKLTSDELKIFLRNLGYFVGNLDREKEKADSTMGLDFMLKKRAVHSPFGKIRDLLAKFRDLQNEEYLLVKGIEDLHRLDANIKSLNHDISETETSIELLKGSISEKNDEIDVTRSRLEEEQKDPTIQAFRKIKIRSTRLEIKIGKKLNFLKKPFRKYVAAGERGGVDIPFELSNVARKYEEDVVGAFLNEPEGFPGLISLLESLTAFVEKGDIRLKAQHERKVKRELSDLRNSKIEDWKAERASLIEEMEKTKQDQDLAAALTQVEKTEQELEGFQIEHKELSGKLESKQKEKGELEEKLEERWEKVREIENQLAPQE